MLGALNISIQKRSTRRRGFDSPLSAFQLAHLLDAATRDVRDKNAKHSSSSCTLRCEDQVESILGKAVVNATDLG